MGVFCDNDQTAAFFIEDGFMEGFVHDVILVESIWAKAAAMRRMRANVER